MLGGAAPSCPPEPAANRPPEPIYRLPRCRTLRLRTGCGKRATGRECKPGFELPVLTDRQRSLDRHDRGGYHSAVGQQRSRCDKNLPLWATFDPDSHKSNRRCDRYRRYSGAVAKWPKAVDCKSTMRRFESARRLFLAEESFALNRASAAIIGLQSAAFPCNRNGMRLFSFAEFSADDSSTVRDCQVDSIGERGQSWPR